MSSQRIDVTSPSYLKDTMDDVQSMIDARRPSPIPLISRNTLTVASVPIVTTPPNTPAPSYTPEPARAARKPAKASPSPYQQFGLEEIREKVPTKDRGVQVNTKYPTELYARYKAKLLEMELDGIEMTKEKFQAMAMEFWLNHLDYVKSQRDNAAE